MYNKWTFFVMLGIVLFLAGISKCSEEDRTATIKTSLAAVQAGIDWADAKIAKKCSDECESGCWEQEDCDYWEANKENVRGVINETIPYVLKKLIKTTTEEEKKEAMRFIMSAQ